MEAITRQIQNLDLVTLLLFVSLCAFAGAKIFDKNKFGVYIILPVNNKYLTIHNKKGKLISWFHLLNTAFQLLNFSIFGYLTIKVFTANQYLELKDLLWYLLLCLFFFVMVKLILQLLTGYIFNIENRILEYIFNKQSYFNYSALIACVGNIILAYVLPESVTVVYLIIGLIFLLNIVGLVNTIKTHQIYIKSHLLYFILYLCALEIAPLVIFGSYLKG
ncbi:DUF4271 domain-containing protein [Croceivirga lutea]|uniref:DUF4271 domain-containing protein n=1 Tax=Croceivirga lutea TaxID=1775167 RepID=UPI0016397391|nr:DUF4271 domain-containing protein [Croceivirga lutea]GGG36664.1 DUF4271 domain-containing protein [Croceivirga lutea]